MDDSFVKLFVLLVVVPFIVSVIANLSTPKIKNALGTTSDWMARRRIEELQKELDMVREFKDNPSLLILSILEYTPHIIVLSLMMIFSFMGLIFAVIGLGISDILAGTDDQFFSIPDRSSTIQSIGTFTLFAGMLLIADVIAISIFSNRVDVIRKVRKFDKFEEKTQKTINSLSKRL
jgi:hypothetical protein